MRRATKNVSDTLLFCLSLIRSVPAMPKMPGSERWKKLYKRSQQRPAAFQCQPGPTGQNWTLWKLGSAVQRTNRWVSPCGVSVISDSHLCSSFLLSWNGKVKVRRFLSLIGRFFFKLDKFLWQVIPTVKLDSGFGIRRARLTEVFGFEREGISARWDWNESSLATFSRSVSPTSPNPIG